MPPTQIPIPNPPPRGFIFLETDRISSLPQSGWNHALDEVSSLTRIALGTPIPGEGHVPQDRHLCLGIVPWAPVPGGAEALDAYMEQDKAAGTMLGEGFLEGLRWLGREGFVFDLGVDARSGGLGQLREAVEMMGLVYTGEKPVTIVINHLCKPDLRLEGDVRGRPEFVEWRELVTKMACASRSTYMKLSGALSELPPLGREEVDFGAVVDRLQPWTDVVFDVFGAERVMFGSDWPVCNIGGGGNDVAWGRWRRVVEEVLERRGLSEEQKRGVWGSVALKAYGIEI
ncbi:Amidohydrolase 2 [Penicillium paradoxum]|uniref:Amidohydrolase 2 n=1 Tax=Penicillium paradoxum TaxID=176176 RepID=UPI00254867C8|nr:Amidohydrolase 2 [Penicillium paradoxum]KAJ5782750.1 Amidohydrolase 2 [Penicillium paradoxum]